MYVFESIIIERQLCCQAVGGSGGAGGRIVFSLTNCHESSSLVSLVLVSEGGYTAAVCLRGRTRSDDGRRWSLGADVMKAVRNTHELRLRPFRQCIQNPRPSLLCGRWCQLRAQQET